MNEDFLTSLRKPPRPEFAAALHKRISRPMDIQYRLVTLRRIALAFSALVAAFVLTLFVSPKTRAVDFDLWRKVGAILLCRSDPSISPESDPTAEPSTNLEIQHALSAVEASQAAGFGVYAPSYLPNGYTPEGQWGIFLQGKGVIVFSHYSDADGHFLHLDQFKPGPGDQYKQSLEESQDVIVRAQPGLWITGRTFRNSAGTFIATNWWMWEEHGINYTIYSDVLTLEESLKIAEALGQSKLPIGTSGAYLLMRSAFMSSVQVSYCSEEPSNDLEPRCQIVPTVGLSAAPIVHRSDLPGSAVITL